MWYAGGGTSLWGRRLEGSGRVENSQSWFAVTRRHLDEAAFA